MKLFGFILFSISLVIAPAKWGTDFTQAKKSASENNKFLLLNFSGSDWCGPCIQLKKEIFDSDVFNTYASQNFELVNADFPRQKKNKLSPELTQQNDSLASIYNPNGEFPLTILFNPKGKIIKEWEGFPGVSSQEFVNQIKIIVDANH